MNDILRELIATAEPYNEEYFYCNYREGSEECLREVLKNKMEDFKKEGVINDFLVRQESFDVSPSLEIGDVFISWVTKDGKLDGATFNWKAY